MAKKIADKKEKEKEVSHKALTQSSDGIKKKSNGPRTTYEERFCEMLINHMSSGLSFESFGAVVGRGKATLYKWVQDYPEFSHAKDVANVKAQQFFEKRLAAKISGQDLTSQGIDTKKIDTSCLIFALKTRFHETYGDRQKVDHTTNGENLNLSVEFIKPENED